MTIVWILFFAGMLVTMVPIMADRSRYRPGNVAPIQLISTIGAWALLLLDASIGNGSLIGTCASFATLLTTVVLFLQDDTRVVSHQTHETIDAMVGEIRQILGGTHRAGIEDVSAVIVTGSIPFIGVSVPRRGHIVVRVRQDFLSWLERHRSPGGAGDAAAESLLRFMFLHELGHILNGDHLTYRFVRSVLVAQLWWLLAAAIGCATSRDVLITSLCLVPPFLAQRFLARRFLAEREEDADSRGMQALNPADASRLRTRKRSGPTELEKLMTDLNIQAPLARPAIRPLSKLIGWIWPESGRIRERSELVADGRGGRAAEPKRWAAWMGMQCGLLAVSILAAFDIALPVALIVMALICSMAATYCGMRVDPARVRLDDLTRVPTRRTVGAIFYLYFSGSALVLYLLPAFSGTLSYPLFAFAVAVSAPQVFLGSYMAAARAEGGPEDAARALRHPVLRAAPSILISLAIIAGCSLLAVWCFGVAWPGPAILTFTAVTTSIVSNRSTSAAARAVAPIAILDSPGNIYAIRIFWRDLYFDRAVTSELRIGVIGLSTYAAITLLFACGSALAAKAVSIVAGEAAVFGILVLMSAVLAGLLSRIPTRDRTTVHLSDLEHVQMFESLLTAMREAGLPPARLNDALALWLRGDASLPHAVLPEPRAIWKLESLLPLIRIARAVGEEETLARWRDPIAHSLRRIVAVGAVSLKRSQPSLAYSLLAALVVEDAGLTSEIPMEPMLDSIAEQLEQWLNGRTRESAGPVASACRLLAAHGRPQPAAERIRMRSLFAVESLLARPIVRKAVGDLAAYTALLEDSAVQARLAGIVRSRLWESLLLTPDNDVSLLLDCYLTAISLDEKDSSHLAAAKSAIGEIAERMADELTKVCRGMQDVTSSRSAA